jgi:hypothetical protein
MRTNKWCAVIVTTVCLGVAPVWGAEPETLKESQFQERMRGLAAERGEAERLSQAVDLVTRHALSSLQVKAIATRLSNDAARLEFAIAAYPRTVDPENFYEVYDAFTSFSKVMRLHDWIREKAQPSRAAVIVVPGTVSDEEARDIVQALRKESFDQSRDKLARQILTSSRKKFLAAQIKAMLQCFDFDAARLELAKFAYDCTFDRDRYFQVNDAFDFAGNREGLSQYIQERNKSSPPQRR